MTFGVCSFTGPFFFSFLIIPKVLGPCGLNTPHTHPRATEIQLLLSGGPLYNQFVMENGARLVKDTIEPGMAMVFPSVPAFIERFRTGD